MRRAFVLHGIILNYCSECATADWTIDDQQKGIECLYVEDVLQLGEIEISVSVRFLVFEIIIDNCFTVIDDDEWAMNLRQCPLL